MVAEYTSSLFTEMFERPWFIRLLYLQLDQSINSRRVLPRHTVIWCEPHPHNGCIAHSGATRNPQGRITARCRAALLESAQGRCPILWSIFFCYACHDAGNRCGRRWAHTAAAGNYCSFIQRNIPSIWLESDRARVFQLRDYYKVDCRFEPRSICVQHSR